MKSIILIILLFTTCTEAAKKHKLYKQRNSKRKRISRELAAVPGGWSEWSLYSLCNSVECTESWARYCNNPRPQHGGATCAGDSLKKMECRDTSKCKKDTEPTTAAEEVTFGQQHWSRWGPCSVTCGVGTRSRSMLPCNGADCETQEQPCIKISCTALNGYSEWSEWGECLSCVQQRTRSCIRDDICGYKIETETHRCECSLDTATMTECQRILNDHTNFGRIGYRIECQDDGMYAPRQCDKEAEKCWCVEARTGRQIFGTVHPHHMAIYDCDTLSQLTHCQALQEVGRINLVASDYSPQCNADGSYVVNQLSDVYEVQWCVYRDGFEIPGSRISLNEDIDCDIELSQMTKCEATTGSDCTTEGEFQQTQCYADGEYTVCRCVYANGQHKDATETTRPGVPECSIYPDLSLTKCRAISLVSTTVTCLPSGEFAPEHCSKDMCICVNNDGTLVHGSGTPIDAIRRTSCDDLIQMKGNVLGPRPDSGGRTRTPIFTRVPDTTTGWGESGSSSSMDFTPEPSSTQFMYTQTFPSLFSISSSPLGPDNLEFVQYDEWSAWSSCSVECGGGFRSASRSCPETGNACGGPDISNRWDECNDLPCIEAAIEELEYEWSADATRVTVTCKAIGLPMPHVVLRNITGYMSEDTQIEEDGRSLVRYIFPPTEDTSFTCIATGEAQDRRSIDIVTQPAEISSFWSSASVIYLNQDVTIECSVTGLPRPGIRLTRDGQIIEATEGSELMRVVLAPSDTTTYTCTAVAGDEAIASSVLSVAVINPCLGVQCQEHASCVVEDGGNTTCICSSCSAGSDLDTVELVCANDCNTYLNECDMQRAGCLGAVSLHSIFQGSCQQLEAPVITSSCPASEVPVGSDLTLSCATTVESWDNTVWYKGNVRVGQGTFLVLSGLATRDSGEYTCSVSDCGGTANLSCPITVVEKDFEECVQYGAGHFHQFSGATFNYPGVCHYVLAMDCQYGSFYIYTGTSQCGTAATPLAYASSVTVFVGRDAVVLLRGFDVNEFGVMKHLHPGDELVYQNFRMNRVKDVMHLTHPNTNFTLSWDGLTVVALKMPKSYAGQLCGLCGDVGLEGHNEVEDAQSHGASYEVDRYDRCNVADIPENTCSSQAEYDEAEQQCYASLYSNTLSKCHNFVPVEEYLSACIFDTCGVHWLSYYNTGLCNVVNAYAISCEDTGVNIQGWRDGTPCPRQLMHKIAYMSKKKRRRKRSVGYSDFDIMMGGD